MRILAIDPGYEKMGIAVVENKNKPLLLYSTCHRTGKNALHTSRLLSIGTEIARLIEEYRPDCLAIETLFFNNNAKTATKVSEARGVIMYEAARHNLKVEEFSPQQVKIAVTGYGKADKKQILSILPRLITIPASKKREDDEYDAIAIGLCCLASTPH